MRRDTELADFLAAFGAAVAASPDPMPRAKEVAALALAALAERHPAGDPAAPQTLPACAALPDAVANAVAAAAEAAPVATLARAVEGLSPRLRWRRRDGSDGDFAARHASARVIGEAGLASHDRVSVGISLLSPGTTYPDHHHPPEEVYVALSEGEWRQGDGPWRAPGPGGLVHNPPDILHTMRSGARPLLAVWCLWGG